MSAPSQPQHRIFISHSHIDNGFGTRLAQDLRRLLGDESAVWYDVLGGLHGGDAWWEKIVEELIARDVFLLVLSPEAMNSPWVRREINMALNENKFILPLLYRECSIRADLKTIQTITFLAPKIYEVAFKEVLVALGLPAAEVSEPERIASHPVDTGTALLRQMEVSFAGQDWPDVLRKADYIIKRLPERASAMVYRLQGLAFLEDGEVQQGQEALETALALVTDRQIRLTLLGDYTTLLASQNQWARVLKQAKEALRLVPNDPGWLATQDQAQIQLAKLSLAQMKSEAPIRVKDKAPQSVPLRTKEQWLEEGNSHYNAKEYREALDDYDRAIQLDTQYANGYVGRGLAYHYLKEYQKSLVDYDQALELDPRNAIAYYNRGLTYYELKEYRKAIADYDQALELDPQYTSAYYNRARTYYELKEYRKAIADYDQALQLDPRKVDTYVGRGVAYYDLKEYQKSLVDYDQALELNPRNAIAYYNRGCTYYDLKEYRKAIADYDQALELDPQYTSAYYNRGCTYYDLKEYQKAIADYDRTLELDPQHTSAYYNRARTYYDLKEYQKSLVDYDRTLELDPRKVDAYVGRGVAYYDLGKYQKAIADYDRALQIDPNYTLAKENKELAYRMLHGKS